MSVDALHNNGPESDGIAPEDRARAEVYALLSNLFYEPPPAKLLHAIATTKAICNDVHVDVQGSEFCKAWHAMQQAAAEAGAESVKDEYDAAFIGTGRQPIMLYGSYYLAGFLNEKPLAQLRGELTQMGVARRENRHETEDHISALCDVMRLLIAGGDDRAPATLDQQRAFFLRHLYVWQAQLCAAILNAGQTRFYKHVARVAQCFFEIESESFAIA
jgi:TorA maturation chaperone TorD